MYALLRRFVSFMIDFEYTEKTVKERLKPFIYPTFCR